MAVKEAIEPLRKSLLDVLRENFERASRVTFIHRIIYIGEHSFDAEGKHTVAEFMQKVILKLNKEYNAEPLTGVLLYYPKYFCHILEASEDTLMKQLRRVISSAEYNEKIKRMKLLACYHHCNQRFLRNWLAITGKPPTLLEKIDPNCDTYRASRYIYQCVQKLYKLANFQRLKIDTYERELAARIIEETQEIEGAVVPSSTELLKQIQSECPPTSISTVMEKHQECLPEYGLVDFLLTTVYTRPIEDYLNIYELIPPLDSYQDKIWPIPSDFIPFNVFDKPIDPITDLPSNKMEETVDVLEMPE